MNYNLDDQLFFGKYRGMTVKDVILIKPRYMKWVMDKTEHTFSSEVELFIRLYAKLETDNDCDATEADIY